MHILFNLLSVLQQLLGQFLSTFVGALGSACAIALVTAVKHSKNRK